jgi:hypothetical protein
LKCYSFYIMEVVTKLKCVYELVYCTKLIVNYLVPWWWWWTLSVEQKLISNYQNTHSGALTTKKVSSIFSCCSVTFQMIRYVSIIQFTIKPLFSVPSFLWTEPSVAVIIVLVASSFRRFNSINLHHKDV